jgi:hypothetical protein
LCRLDAASTLVTTTMCTVPCPYPTCACSVTACPSGAVQPSSTNPATPFYPAEDPTCCAVGFSLREVLVGLGDFDCSAGRPCAATTGVPSIGTLRTAL